MVSNLDLLKEAIFSGCSTDKRNYLSPRIDNILQNFILFANQYGYILEKYPEREKDIILTEQKNKQIENLYSYIEKQESMYLKEMIIQKVWDILEKEGRLKAIKEKKS